MPQFEPSCTYRFPLPTDGPVRRTGFGLDPVFPASVNITLYARLAQHIPTLWSPSIPAPQVTRFCIHLDGDIPFASIHSPYSVQHTERPLSIPCGSHPNRLVYQLYGAVWQYLRSHALFDDAHFREAIFRSLNVLVEHCIVCNGKIATDYTLLRSTTCSRACSRQLRKSQLLVRLPELIKDFEAVKLHFFAVGGAIRTGKFHVPTGSLPSMSSIEMLDHARRVWERFLQPFNVANSIESWIAYLEPRTELFMAWVLTSYRGVLITMPRGLYPSLDCQILFASANPQAEATFAKRLLPTGGKSQPVFHGTTIDRLQSILHIGLQTQTKPNMRRWGNLLGDGIYTTDTSEVA